MDVADYKKLEWSSIVAVGRKYLFILVWKCYIEIAIIQDFVVQSTYLLINKHNILLTIHVLNFNMVTHLYKSKLSIRFLESAYSQFNIISKINTANKYNNKISRTFVTRLLIP